VGSLLLFGLLAWLSLRPAASALNLSLVAGSLSDFALAPSSVRSFAVRSDSRPGPLPQVFRFTYPPDWLNAKGESAPPIAVFVDGRRAAWLEEEPYFEQLSGMRTYAYLREPASRSFFVVCPTAPAVGCDRVDVVRNSLAARLALAWSLRDIVGPKTARLLIELLPLGALVALASKRLALPWLGVLLGVELVIALTEAVPPEKLRLGIAVLFLGLALALKSISRGIERMAGAVENAVLEPRIGISLVQIAIFLGVGLLSALPALRTIPGWYPAERDDSHFYISAASRFLRTDNFTQAALDLDNWRYSAYPLLLAGFSKALGLHPMDAYLWGAAVGAILLCLGAGAFAWIASGRVTTALLTTWVAGTWGGLGGFAWLFDQGPAVISGGALRLLDTDYHDSRFFGEFTGPYSELTTYMASVPFYPREAGLIPFWLGLGFLYRRLNPEARPPSLVLIGGFFLASAALYPYYGLAAPLALGILFVAESLGPSEMRTRRHLSLKAGVLVFVLALGIGDLASRVYRGQSAWQWVMHFLESSPLALEANKSMPSLEFAAARILSGEFFLGAAFVAALVLGHRPAGTAPKPQRHAAFLTVGLCVAHGLMGQLNSYFHLLLFNFRWLVSWRSLLTPVIAMSAALFLEHVASQSNSIWSRRRLILLLLTPTLGSLVWSYSVTSYIEKERWTVSTPRGVMAGIWADYQSYGRSMLGRVAIPEPLVIEGAGLGERSAASAAFGVLVIELDFVFTNGGAVLPVNLRVPNGIQSVAVRTNSASHLRLENDSCCKPLGSYGPYKLFERR
jgi:hypothetical protein